MTVHDPQQFLLHAQREILSPFIHKTFNIINPGKQYFSNWHINSIAWHLEEVAAGRIKRLAISMPPRSLKSIVSSVAFPAWLLGKDPTKRIICVSYSQDLANKHSRDFRRLLKSSEYKSLTRNYSFNSNALRFFVLPV